MADRLPSMSVHILDAMARGGFEQVLALHDRRSGLRGFLGIHDTSRGPAFGGVRRWAYADEAQALRDCLRLSRAMTRKCALADLPAGGGKLVLGDDAATDWGAGYQHVGRVVDRLQGSFYTGPDVGTGPLELGWVRSQTRYVTDPGPAGPGLLAEATCEGVFRGIAAALRHVDGEEDWPRRRVVVQGLGGVGRGLAQRLVQRGVHVLAAEIDEEKAQQVARDLALELVDPASEFDHRCDVFAPCALGGILHDLTITRLRCRIVAGGANNVIVRTEHGERLHELGILYAPDVVINSGALIRGAHFHLEGRRIPVAGIGARVARTLTRILEHARAEGEPPVRVAVREADRRIAAWRAERPADGSKGQKARAADLDPGS
jgi:leucine dehydrogenase